MHKRNCKRSQDHSLNVDLANKLEKIDCKRSLKRIREEEEAKTMRKMREEEQRNNQVPEIGVELELVEELVM
jgi:hypothetical protein